MNNGDYDKLIAAASGKLGTAPEKLKETLEKGDLAALSGGLSKSDKQKIRALLSNRELMEKLKNASSPEEIINMLTKM